MDFSRERLAQAKSFGCETIDLTTGASLVDQVERILGVREVDCAVDCVGFEAKGHGGEEQPAVVLNQLMDVTRAAGAIGVPGLYVTEDPGAKDAAARKGVSACASVSAGQSLTRFIPADACHEVQPGSDDGGSQ